jgi:mannitol-1-/sugar-/sorbitol-6-/2-deoxyglucose-6-phosphatase
MLDTVIFDMDGLLLDTEPLWGQSMLRVANAHNIPITADKFKETTGLKIHEVVHYWSIKYPWVGSPFEVVAEDILDDIIALAKKDGSIMSGVNQLLELLKINNFKIGVATSSPTRMMDALINHFNLNNYFSYMASADEVGFGKPHPAVFLHCAEKLNSTALKCLVLEDSLNGVIAGKAARMKVIAVPDDIHFNDVRYSLADMKLKSLKELNMEIIRSF